jgi:tRNA-dihydrouridine synthase B
VKLGALELKNPFILAPLESVSDAAFRRICFELGASLTFTEMIRARGIVRNNKSTLDLIDTVDAEVPTGLQLLVTGETELCACLEKLEQLAATSHPHFKNISVIDLNFGCPSPDVIRVGAGPALLKRVGKLEKIFDVLASFKRRGGLNVKAVGAKIRLGLNAQEKQNEIYLPIVDLANRFLDYLTVHARHARQSSESPADWQSLVAVRARATIPIVGNGDVLSPQDFARFKAISGCEAVLIARGAIASPFLFRALIDAAQSPKPVDSREVDRLETRYLELARQFKPKEKFMLWHREGFARMRKRLEGISASEALPENSNF